MYALILFDNYGSYTVCERNKILQQIDFDKFVVKFNGYKYEAKLIAFHESKSCLEEFASYLNEGTPKVLISDIYQDKFRDPNISIINHDLVQTAEILPCATKQACPKILKIEILNHAKEKYFNFSTFKSAAASKCDSEISNNRKTVIDNENFTLIEVDSDVSRVKKVIPVDLKLTETEDSVSHTENHSSPKDKSNILSVQSASIPVKSDFSAIEKVTSDDSDISSTLKSIKSTEHSTAIQVASDVSADLNSPNTSDPVSNAKQITSLIEESTISSVQSTQMQVDSGDLTIKKIASIESGPSNTSKIVSASEDFMQIQGKDDVSTVEKVASVNFNYSSNLKSVDDTEQSTSLQIESNISAFQERGNEDQILNSLEFKDTQIIVNIIDTFIGAYEDVDDAENNSGTLKICNNNSTSRESEYSNSECIRDGSFTSSVRRLSFDLGDKTDTQQDLENDTTINSDVNFNSVNSREKFIKTSQRPKGKEHDEEDMLDFVSDGDSDSDYDPNLDAESLSEGEGIIESPKNSSLNGSSNINKSSTLNNSSKSNNSSILNVSQAPDHSELDIDASRGKSGAGKKHCCIYCKKLVIKIARHLENVHGKEKDVKKFSILPPSNQERREIIDKLRKDGDYAYNTSRTLNKGQLITCRRPDVKFSRKGTDFEVCPKCRGWYSKNTFRHHFSRCTNNEIKNCRSVKIMSRKISGQIHKDACKLLRNKIFPVLRDDDIVRHIRYDALVIDFANKLCEKYGELEHQHDLIRSKLRIVGRFIMEMRKISKDVTDMKSVINPRNYKHCKEAIKNVAGFDEKTRTYRAPSNVSNLYSLLKQLSDRLVFRSIEMEDSETQEKAENFLKVIVHDFGSAMNKTAVEATVRNQRNNQKKMGLPSKEDIQKLHNHLSKIKVKEFNSLSKKFTFESWLALSEATLILLQLFNRRRAGELERLLIEDYKVKDQITNLNMGGNFNDLTASSKSLVQMYSRVEIRGKLRRTVSLLIRCDLVECINLILKYRQDANVSPKNPHVFGLSSGVDGRIKHLKACSLLRRFSNECGATNPITLRGTLLRKHVATICTELNLEENDILALADFMGHDAEIHKKIYRQPTINRDVIQISKILRQVLNLDDCNSAKNKNDQNLSEDENDSNLTEDENDHNLSEIENQNNSSENANNYNASTTLEYSEVQSESIELSFQQNKEAELKRKANKKRKLTDNEAEDEIEDRKISRKKRSSSEMGAVKRVKWNPDEKKIVLDYFGSYIDKSNLPSLKEIEKIKNNCTNLNNRSAAQIKTWLNNQQRKYRNNNSSPRFSPRNKSKEFEKNNLEQKINDFMQDGLCVKQFVGKGRGIVATRDFMKDEFVVEYVGVLVSRKEGLQLEKEYEKRKKSGCFLFFFNYCNKTYCIDATKESHNLGRLINHSRKGLLKPRIIELNNTPRLVFFAKQHIPSGTELTYDYGDRRQSSLNHFSWLKM